MLLRDIVPCRCLARTHLQGQQLDMCKGQSSRSSFVEAGRAVPFAVDVVRFVMIKSVSAVASEWIRLQVSMGNQPTNQPASQPTNRSSRATAEAVSRFPMQSPARTKTVRRPLQVLVRGGDNMQRWHCRTQQAEQQQPSPKPIHPHPPRPHTDMSCYRDSRSCFFDFLGILCYVIQSFAYLRPGCQVEDTVGHCFCEPLTVIAGDFCCAPPCLLSNHCRRLALAIARSKPGGVKVWFQASGWQKSWAGRKPSPVDTCDTYLQTLVFDNFLMYYTVFCLRFGSISFRQIVLLTSFANWMPLLQVSATSQRILLVQMLIFLCKSPYVLVMS